MPLTNFNTLCKVYVISVVTGFLALLIFQSLYIISIIISLFLCLKPHGIYMVKYRKQILCYQYYF